MVRDDDTAMGGNRRSFPTTHWSKLEAVRGDYTPEHRTALNYLIRRYWKPVYHYVRRKGATNEEAKDLVQEFFTSWLAKGIFGRADPIRGRFRAFMLSSLDNFLRNAHRNSHTQIRYPKEGFVSIHDLAADGEVGWDLQKGQTPEEAFLRTWASDLVIRVLAVLEKECEATGKTDHYTILLQREIQPALEGTEPTPMKELADKLGLTDKQASARLVTARRAYQRILQAEIKVYASSDEEVADEVKSLFRNLANS